MAPFYSLTSMPAYFTGGIGGPKSALFMPF